MSDKQTKASPKKKPYTLKVGVSIDGKWNEKGSKVNLTDEGARFFKFKNRI